MATDTVRLSSDGIFYTLQGEGPLVGVPSIFVRLDSCNLRCKWGDTVCDAYYTSWEPGQGRKPISELCSDIEGKMMEHQCWHVVLTGGEPTLQHSAVKAIYTKVVWDLNQSHLTIETNGTHYIEGIPDALICISPKLSRSVPKGTKYEGMHEKNRLNFGAMEKWIFSNPYYFKFVIDQKEDVDEALGILDRLGILEPTPELVCFMPQGITSQELWERGRWLAEICKDLGVRFTPRIQVDLWGNRPGT